MNLKPLPPPPGSPAQTPEPVTAGTDARFSIIRGRIAAAQSVVLYGPGGIGKTTLAALAPNAVFADVEHGTNALDVPRLSGIETWADLRASLQSNAYDDYQTIVIDTLTKAEELAVAHTLATIPNEKGQRVTSIEGYGFGKGYQHVYETFLLLLADLDSQIRRGRNVILIAHDCVADVPNPVGEDFIRYEPHLQSPKSGKASIRNRVVQWAEHVLFLGYDVVTKDGKGLGGGTRTIYPIERPDHIAKSRTVTKTFDFANPTDDRIWKEIFSHE